MKNIEHFGAAKLTMSNFSQVGDLLHHINNYMTDRRDFHLALAQKSADKRIKILLIILAEHKSQWCRAMVSYIAKAPAKIFNTQF
ncbi:MAG: hypothetical protein ACI8R9_001675 [Paraglaciecola sp.]